eukprot:1328967-Amorphochlora_amoeboformis.AAC.1
MGREPHMGQHGMVAPNHHPNHRPNHHPHPNHNMNMTGPGAGGGPSSVGSGSHDGYVYPIFDSYSKHGDANGRGQRKQGDNGQGKGLTGSQAEAQSRSKSQMEGENPHGSASPTPTPSPIPSPSPTPTSGLNPTSHSTAPNLGTRAHPEKAGKTGKRAGASLRGPASRAEPVATSLVDKDVARKQLQGQGSLGSLNSIRFTTGNKANVVDHQHALNFGG